MKKVSVIIPTYDREHYLPCAIQSVMRQTMRDFEIIVVDDGSTDNTWQLCRQFGDLRYLHQENAGCASARNRGIRSASGQYMAFLDSDDLFAPRKLEYQTALLDRYPEAGFVFSDSIEFRETDDGPRYYLSPVVARRNPREFAFRHFMHPGVRMGSLLIRRTAIGEDDMFDETMRFNEDSDFVQSLAIRTAGLFGEYPSVLMRHHASNKSSNRVEIINALIYSSEKILSRFPEFHRKLGREKEEKRLAELRHLLAMASEEESDGARKDNSVVSKIIAQAGRTYVRYRRKAGNKLLRRREMRHVGEIMREMESLLSRNGSLRHP